jgi:hypothetical protein
VEDALFRFSPPSSWSCVCILPHCWWKISIYKYIYRRWMVIVQLLFFFSFNADVRLFDQKRRVKEWEEEKKNLYTIYL